MSFLGMLALIFIIPIPFLVWLFIIAERKVDDVWRHLLSVLGILCFTFAVLGCAIAAIIQPFSLKKEAIRQEKERQQILYQVEHLTESSDKVKLNEWILSYNDWVNDINTGKEMWGWVSWHDKFDMSNHGIIPLV
jgi:hypothetical protein